MVEMRADTRAFKEAIKRAVASGPLARRGTLLDIAYEFGRQVMLRSPVDTGRFKRAEAQALNAAEVGRFPLETVKPGKDKLRRRIEARLIVQLRFWQRVKTSIEAKGEATYKTKRGTGQTKHYRDAIKRVALSEQYLAEFRASAGTAAVIGVEFWQRLSEARRRKTPIDPNRILTRAYSKVYGGTGSVIQGNGQTVIQLINREPHAYIVEQKRQVRGGALTFVGRDVLRRVGPGYVKKIVAASGLAVSA